jgi:hypothetical protein
MAYVIEMSMTVIVSKGKRVVCVSKPSAISSQQSVRQEKPRILPHFHYEQGTLVCGIFSFLLKADG